MNKYIFYTFIILHSILSVSLYSQKVEDKLIIWLENNSREELMNRLEKLKQTSPNSPAPIYIEAIMEIDAEQAVLSYKKIIQKFPSSIYAEQSLLKLAQYYFMRESYIQARQLLDNLIDKFSNSKLASTAKYLAALCLIATNNKLQAEKELKNYIKEFPDSQFQEIVQAELDRIVNRSRQEKNISKMIAPQQKIPIHTSLSDKTKIYTVQVGAFGNRENAERHKKLFQEKKYSTNIQTKYVGGRLLYLVWVENFEAIDEAQKFGNILKNQFDISFRIIRK
jgi:predicted negative regulator of RcsB-dependent stress response